MNIPLALIFTRTPLRRVALALLGGATVLATTACAPLLLGGAVAGAAMVSGDRRSTGTQLDDQTLELRGLTRARDIIGPNGHVNVTSYNRMVLITGEVAGEAERASVAKAVAGLGSVGSVVNELVVAPNSSLPDRSSDTLLTARVKATLVEAADIPATAFKVVTERGVVYLMGRVSETEAARATERARSVTGVKKVVRLMEIIGAPEAPAPKAEEPKK